MPGKHTISARRAVNARLSATRPIILKPAQGDHHAGPARPETNGHPRGRLMQHFEGTVTINAPRDEVWKYLTDPEKVGKCAPGVESVKVVEGQHKFHAIAAIGFGTVKARFTGDAEFVELDEPNRARLKAHGKAPGSAMDVMTLMV